MGPKLKMSWGLVYAAPAAYGPAVGPQPPVTYNLQPAPAYIQPPPYSPVAAAPVAVGGFYGAAAPAAPPAPYAPGQIGGAVANGESNIINAQGVSGFDSSLAGGVPGGPGIRFRVNKPAFRYASQMIAPILSNQIRNAQIPQISQCLPQVDGCLRVSNVAISHYQCPERIQIRPAPPNQVVIVIKNANLQVSGVLGGRVTVLAPIALSGQFIATAQGLSISVGITVTRSATGGIFLQVASCHATVGSIQLQIFNGGILGELASNPTFSQKISRAMKKILPPRICAQLPQILNERVNGKLATVQTSLPLTKIVEVAGGALKPLLNKGGAAKAVCPAECKEEGSANESSGVSGGGQTDSIGQHLEAASPPSDPPHRQGYTGARGARTVKVRHESKGIRVINKRSVRQKPLRSSPKSHLAGRRATAAAVVTAKRQVDCTPCHGGGGGGDDATSFLLTFTKSLDMSKLNDILLSLNLLGISATTQDVTVDLSGEFSPNGAGGTPFAPYPLQFPAGGQSRMAEALLSDYTLNSLFYWLHQKGFINIKIGPDTPQVGDILKTTCSDDEDEGLEDHGVELDDADIVSRRRRIRVRRQDEEGGGSLADLGICLGDILPAVREKYPKKRIEIVIKSTQAPSVVLSEGKAHVALFMDAELYIEETHEKVGTISTEIAADINVSTKDGKLSGTASISKLSLKDKEQTLGLPQDALDNLGNLGKDFVEKAINDALEKGISLSIPPGVGGLPISFQNLDFKVVDHALYVAADIDVDSVGLAPLLAEQGLSLQGDQCSTRG